MDLRTNVFFVGDSYRGDQATNIQRLYEIFGHVVNACGAKAELRISHLNRLTGFENWLPGWVRSLQREETSILSDLDAATSAVVAFELSGVDRIQLDAAGIPWVNFEIHPVRFLEDLYFSVEASFPIDLSRVGIPDDYVSLRAEVLRAKYRPEARAQSENRLLIVGQAPNDKSIYFDGEFKQLPNYFARLDPIVAGFNGVDYRPHPYLTDGEVDANIRSRYKAGACDEPNIYKVFTSGRYRAVCGISSSVLSEAPYFGLQSMALEPRARQFGRPMSYAKLIRDCHLWLNGLLEVAAGPRAYDALPPVPENYLRQVYCSWAYVTQEEEIRQALSSIDIRVQQAERGVAGLLQGLNKERLVTAAASPERVEKDSDDCAGILASVPNPSCEPAKSSMKLPEPPYPLRDAAYYQRLHEDQVGYQTNNWLLEELDQIRAFGGESLLEIACGDGRFIESAAPFFKRVTGCDWAVSPRLQEVLSRNLNVSFQRVDMYRDLPVGQPDLVVSADFLEHLAPKTLPEVLRRIDSLGPKAFHKIACYDDGHSHLSIMPPGKWLALFRVVDPRYRLERVELRLGDPAREIAVYTKGRPVPVALEVEQVLAVAQSLLNVEAFEEAQETLGEGLLQHPGDRLLRLAQANVLLAQENPSQAIEILKALAEEFPSDPLVLVNLGGAFLRTGQLDEAGVAACRAYALAPESQDVCLLMKVLEPLPHCRHIKDPTESGRLES